jgi:8-oxo-dGTP pyrophosphatase MutT (NUDIX family)
MNVEPQLMHLDRLDLHFVPKRWAFADEKRAEIDAFFARLQRDKPALWNGRVLLMHRHVVTDGVFTGEYLETDYASFLAWSRWGEKHAGVRDCFSAAAVVSGDGAVLLGEMAPHTAHAGQIYFPAGTPDPSDIAGGKVDLAASVARELKEETGVDIAELAPEPGWTAVLDGPLIVQVKTLRSALPAADLRARMLAHLASEETPELCDIHIVRSPRDVTPAMPPFVTAWLDAFFDQGGRSGPRPSS